MPLQLNYCGISPMGNLQNIGFQFLRIILISGMLHPIKLASLLIDNYILVWGAKVDLNAYFLIFKNIL